MTVLYCFYYYDSCARKASPWTWETCVVRDVCPGKCRALDFAYASMILDNDEQ